MSCSQENRRPHHSGHMVEGRVAKKIGDHTMSIIIQEERKQLFHVCIIPWPLLQSTPFLHYSCPPDRVRHTANLIKYRSSKFHFNFFVFFLCRTRALISLHTLCKNCYKMQTCNPIALIFDTNKKRVTVDSCTKFVVKLRNIQSVMSIYSCKKDKTSVKATG